MRALPGCRDVLAVVDGGEGGGEFVEAGMIRRLSGVGLNPPSS